MPATPIRPDLTTAREVGALVSELGLTLHSGPSGARVTGVSLSSSQVLPGDVFVALPGRQHHGADYAADAVASGATAIITDPAGLSALADLDVPVIVTDDPRGALGRVAKWVYNPGIALPSVLAVTGTNGKTSSVFYIDAIYRAVGITTALSNSSERTVAGETFHTPLTTPEAPELQALLALAAQRGAAVMALEASAQAIERHRLDEIVAEVAGFTNLSHDHFEDYGDMDTYLERKLPLFQPDMSRRAVVSLESAWGSVVAARAGVPLTTIGPEGHPEAQWHYAITGSSPDGEEFVLSGPGGELRTRIGAWGEHMVRNASLACLMAIEAGVSLSSLTDALGPGSAGIDVVIPGRIEKVSGESSVAVFVDAGRSADAYQHTFETIRRHRSGALIIVIGTSGNRDRSKRPVMGKIAAHFADVVVVTDDDPRFEDPDQIRADLLLGARAASGSAVHEIPDPATAIRFAIGQAHPGDTVVWMGPGSQYYREIQGVREPYSAREQAVQALRSAGYLPSGSKG